MARVIVYVRPVDAVFMDLVLGHKMDPPKYGTKVKEEPSDSDINSQDDSALVDVSANDQTDITEAVNKSSDAQNSKSVLPQESADAKSITLDVAKGVHKHKQSPKTVNSCDICLLKCRNRRVLNSHKKSYKGEFKCKFCNALFGAQKLVDRHEKLRLCTSRLRLPGIFCYFCNRHFCNKLHLQSHIFHLHNDDLMHSTKVAEQLPETPETSNDTSLVSVERLKNLDNTIINSPSSSMDVDLQNLNVTQNSTVSSPSISSKKSADGTTMEYLSNSCNSTPSKRMKQTILTDYISLYKEKPKDECVTPEKVDTAETASVSSSSDMSELLNNKISTTSQPSQISTPKHSEPSVSHNKKPFVQIHVNSSTMISLLNKEIKTEPENFDTSLDTSYNLRPGRVNSYSPYPHNLITYEASRSLKRRKHHDLSKQTQRTSLPDKQPKSEFKYKECIIRLKRCDKVLKSCSYTSDKDVEAFERVDLKIVKEDPENSQKMDTVSNSFLTNVTESTEKIITSESGARDVPKNGKPVVKVNEKKPFPCHVCKKAFSLKENLHEHMELFHSIYMSSICSARYTTMNKLLSHYFRQHIVLKRKECCVCYEKFETSAILRQHMTLHCLKTIRSKKDQKIDVEINCNAFKKRYKCKACYKRFWLHSCLEQHEKVCRKMKALVEKQMDKQKIGIKRSLSNTPKGLNNLKVSLTRSPNPEKVSLVQTAELVGNSDPCTLDTNDTVSPTPTVVNKRILDGVACVEGYEPNMTDKIKFPCTICGKQFQTFQNLCIHERTFCKPANNQCNVCGTSFPTKRLLQLHMLATHTPVCEENYRFFCKFCHQGFVKKANLRIHERHFHAGQVPNSMVNAECIWNLSPVCNTCNLLFESYKQFIEHNMYYYKGQIFVCTVCNKSFQGMYSLHHHNKMEHYADNIRKLYAYKCNICNEGFNYESNFHAHKLHVHLHDAPVIQNALNTMQDHSYALTNNSVVATEIPMEICSKNYVCIVCTLNFTNEKDLLVHEMEYTMGGQYQCDECNRCFLTKSILAKHYSLNHTGCDINTSFKCHTCGEIVTTTMAMLCHEKHFHRENNNFKTRYSVVISQLSTYKELKTLIDDCSFTCITCGMKFEDKISLKHHLLEFADIGPHSCSICQRKFTEPYVLEMHKLKHCTLNPLSPHRCPICNEGFADPMNVHAHVAHLHRYETFSFDNFFSTGNSSKGGQSVQKNSSHPSNRLSGPSDISRPSSSDHIQIEMKKCPECNIAFSSNKNLMKHRARFVNSGDYQCAVCERRFPWLTTLEQHIHKHSNANSPFLKHECPHCNEKFRSSVAVYSHIIHIHGKDKLLTHSSTDVTKFVTNNAETTVPVPTKSSTSVKESQNVHNKSNTALNTSDIPHAKRCYGPSEGKRNEGGTILDRLEKSFYYTCLICNLQYPTLKLFQTHFKIIHGKNNDHSKANREQSNDSIVLRYCETIDDNDGNDVKNDGNGSERPSDEKGQGPSDVQVESTNHLALPLNDKSSDGIEIIWEKNTNPIDRGISSAKIMTRPEVQVTDKDVANNHDTIPAPTEVIPINKDVGKLKVRAFAKFVED